MAVIVREKVKGCGEWWVFINHNKKRKSKKIGSKKAANSVAKEIEKRLAKGDLGILKEEAPTIASTVSSGCILFITNGQMVHEITMEVLSRIT